MTSLVIYIYLVKRILHLIKLLCSDIDTDNELKLYIKRPHVLRITKHDSKDNKRESFRLNWK